MAPHVPRSAALLLLVFQMLAVPAWAVTKYARTTNTWTGTTWGTSCSAGNLADPTAADDVVICGTRTVTLNTSTTVQSITVETGAILRIGNNNSARTLTIANGGAGFIDVQGTGQFIVNTGSNPPAGHSIFIDGNLSNAGTFDLVTDGNSRAEITFNGSGTQTISGAGATTDFNRLIVDPSGASTANIVEVTATNFSFDSGADRTDDGLTIVDGTFKLSAGVTIAPFDNGPFGASPAGYEIPSNGRLWLNHASAVINHVSATGNGGEDQNLTLNGNSELRVTDGTLNIGSAADRRIRPLDNSVTVIEGGAVNVAGRYTCQSAPPAGNAFTFNMSGGTFTVGTAGNTSGTFPPFCNGSNGSFQQSGGTIIVARGSTSGSLGYWVETGPSPSVTGGTVQIGDPSVTPAAGAERTIQVRSQNPVWNLVVNNSVVIAQLNTYNLTARNAITLTAGTLDANNLNIDLGDTSGNGGIGSWTNDSGASAFTAGTGTVSFVGPGATSSLGGTAATTFNNLTLNKSSNHLTIASGTPSPTVSGTLALTNGRLITQGASCAATVPVIVDTGGTVSGGSTTSYVQGGIRKNFLASASLDFRAAGDEFPVGDASGYTPVEIHSGTTSAVGNLTVCVTPTEHPNVTSPVGATGTIDAARSVNRYWHFANSGLNVDAAPIDATFKFVAGDVDGLATTGNFIVERWNGTLSTWSPTTLVSAAATSTRASNIVLPAAVNEFAIGEPLSGFTTVPGRFNAYDTGTPAGAVLGKIQTKQAGIAFTLSLVAVNAAKTALDTSHAGTATVQLLDASSGGALDANGCNAGWTLIKSVAGVSFVAGTASITFSGADLVTSAYKNVRVRIIDDPPPAGPLTGCSNDRFAIRPQSLTLTAHDGDWENAGTTRALNNTGASGGAVHKASTGSGNSRPFTLRATPVSGAADSSYDGQPTLVAGFPTCVAMPTTCSSGALTFTAGSWTGSGTRENATAHYSEAGVFQLQLQDLTFADVDVPDGSSAAARTVPATASASIGRFVPDRFVFSSPSTPQFLTFGATCVGARSFTYIGQRFWYATATFPTATIAAVNGAGTTTTNYRDDLFKLAASGISETYSNNATGPALDTALVGSAELSSVGNGTATYSASTLASSKIAYTRSTTHPVPATNNPYTANLSLSVSASDASELPAGNGTISTASAQVFNGAGAGIAFDSGALFRYGIMKLGNAVGSELIDLAMPLEVQYWNGTGFVRNTADNCTTLATGSPPPNISLGNHQPASFSTNLGNSHISLGASGRFVGGLGSLTITKPTPAATGSASATIDLGVTAEDKTYLQSRLTGGSYTDNPVGRAAFGVYGSQPQNFIFFRENY